MLRIGLVSFALVLAACGDGSEEPTDTVTGLTFAPTTTSTSTSTSSTSTSTSSTSTTTSATTPSTETTTGATAAVGPDQEYDHTTPDPTTIQCDDGEIDIRVDAFDLTVTGNCDDIDVYGSGGTLTVEVTHELDVDGSENDIEVEEVGEIDIDGDDNTLTIGTVSEIDVEGNRNSVTFRDGNPDIDDEGQDNSIGADANSA